jgi:hypothetical protein
MVTVGIHDVATVDVEASPSVVWVGETISVNVTVQNHGDYSETFNVAVYANSTEIQTLTLNDVLAGETVELSFDWNTTGLAAGDYGLQAVADTVADETHTADNTYDGGTVTLTQGIHDIAVINATSSKTALAQGYSVNISLTLTNEGNFTENLNLTLSARNASSTVTIETISIANLVSGETRTITVVWTADGWSMDSYTVLACVEPVPNEAHVEDNAYEGGMVSVVLPGDVTANGLVNMIDLYLIAKSFGETAPYERQVTANCDINDDGIINMFDLYISAMYFGERLLFASLPIHGLPASL